MEKEVQNKIFEEVLSEHKGVFFKIAKTYCKDETDRQDLLQEMMINVWQALPRYKSDFKLSTWLYRICLNVAISSYRKNAAVPLHIPIDDDDNQTIVEHQEGDKQQHLQMLEKFIDELKDLDKALMLLYLEDKSHSEIAEILGISPSNVSTKVLRIKEKLKQRFSKLDK